MSFVQARVDPDAISRRRSVVRASPVRSRSTSFADGCGGRSACQREFDRWCAAEDALRDLSLQHESAAHPSRDDADLEHIVQRCLDDDEEAIRAFVARFERVLFSLCLRMLRHREDAEDVVQETFVRAVRNLHRWDPARPILPWLQTIAANRCRTALGKRQKRPELAAMVVEPGFSDESRGEDAEEIDRAMEQLPQNYQDVITMYYRGGLGCAEIAAAFDCAEGTIKTWLFRARKQLAEELAGRGYGEHTE